MKNKDYLLANAICLTCGTAKEDPANACCINGHDNWLEIGDNVTYFEKASKKFGVGILAINNAIKNNKSLSIKKTKKNV